MRTEIIKRKADEIKKKLQPEGSISYLYGEPLDIHNPDEILVAAVAQVYIEMMIQSAKDIDILLRLQTRTIK